MKYLYIDTGRTSHLKNPDNVIVEKSFSQLYDGVFKIFAQISTPCAKNLFIWIISKMDKWNRISLSKSDRSSFNTACLVSSGERYVDGTIKKAIRELLKVGAIVSMNIYGR